MILFYYENNEINVVSNIYKKHMERNIGRSAETIVKILGNENVNALVLSNDKIILVIYLFLRTEKLLLFFLLMFVIYFSIRVNRVS